MIRPTIPILFAIWGLSGFAVPAKASSNLEVTASPGWLYYRAGQYRYGPSIIINPDDTVDIWTASPGGDGQWDWIRHRHSVDGGKSWGTETVCLEATSGSADSSAVCDPGVIKFGEYYYLGYTATTTDTGTYNHVFVARSKSPTGPFEKWNGSGWDSSVSTRPEPFIEFTGAVADWGAGEPSFVQRGNTLFIYYTWMENGGSETRVATASTDDLNWPGHLDLHGVAIERLPGEDSTDVKYVDALGRFIGVGIASRFSGDSYAQFWESTDGLTFSPAFELRDNLQDWAHNCGISGTLNGHFDVNDDNLFGYAYSEDNTVSWGKWNTALHYITIVPEPGVGLFLISGAFLLVSRRIRHCPLTTHTRWL